MKRVLIAGLVVVLGALASGATEARADDAADPVCEGGRVHVVGHLADGWMSEARRVCGAIPTMADVDPTATVTVVSGTPVTLFVVLADGRSATRALTSPRHLRSTVEALITLLPGATPAADAALVAEEDTATAEDDPPIDAREKLRRDARAARQRREAARRAEAEAERGRTSNADTAAPPVEEKRSELGVELGVIAMGRVSGTPAYVSTGPTGWASIELSNWLFGLHIRWDAIEKMVGGTDGRGHMRMTTIGAGLDGSHRFPVNDAVAFDLGTSVRVLETYQTADRRTDQNQGEENGADEDRSERTFSETSGAITDLRFAIFGLLQVGGDGLRGTFSLEAELSALRIGNDVAIDPLLPPLPAWSIGTGAGLSWRGG